MSAPDGRNGDPSASNAPVYRGWTLEETFGSISAPLGQSLDLRREIEDAFSEAMDEKMARWASQHQSFAEEVDER